MAAFRDFQLLCLTPHFEEGTPTNLHNITKFDQMIHLELLLNIVQTPRRHATGAKLKWMGSLT